MNIQEFTKDEYEYFVDKCMFNEELANILKLRIQGCSVVEISMKLNMSVSSVCRRIKEIKKKILKVI